jgi:3-oxoacyl-[acyl-carrier protein] reductase
MLLKDQVALVTGGSRGIGRGIVLALAKEGAKVAFVYKGNQEAADKLVNEITQSGGVAQSIKGDVAQPDAATRIVEKVLSDWS